MSKASKPKTAEAASSRPRFVVTLEALADPDSVAPAVRLRSVLKTALRRSRMRCVKITEPPSQEAVEDLARAAAMAEWEQQVLEAVAGLRLLRTLLHFGAAAGLGLDAIKRLGAITAGLNATVASVLGVLQLVEEDGDGE